jgi:hypothetical protein
MKKILYVRPFAEGLLAHGINDAGGKMTIPIWEVRCGIAAPDDSFLRFYYVMLGQKAEANEEGKKPLIFLCEHEDASQSGFLTKLGEDIRRMMCGTVYADRTGAEKKEFYSILWRLISKSSARLHPAPFAGDVPYGKALVAEWLKDRALELPRGDTILRKELETVSADTGGEPPSFHALRFVLGGFVRFPSQRPVWRESTPQQLKGWGAFV